MLERHDVTVIMMIGRSTVMVTVCVCHAVERTNNALDVLPEFLSVSPYARMAILEQRGARESITRD
jgi:hypothetical protein